MNKLNRKGFTLIELLAVIVILAIVLVVSVPQILGSVSKAKNNQFENAISTIETYVTNQYGLCLLHDSDLQGSDYNGDLFDDDCNLKSNADVVTAAGYSTSDISGIQGGFDKGKYKIKGATAGSEGKFAGAKSIGNSSDNHSSDANG